jgi:hypothetical protein
MADAMAAAGLTLYGVAVYIASKVYEPLSGWNHPSRREAMDILKDRAQLSDTMARRACDTVDIAASVTIDEDTVGTPTIRQLNTIARADIKKCGGWGKVNAWVDRRHGWGNITDEALAGYCHQVKEDDKAEERDRKALRKPEDPHEPPDVEVVDAEIVGRAPRPLNTPEQQDAARRARAADLFKTLAVDGSRMLAAMADFDPTHPWVQENSSDWRRAVEAVDQVKALIDDATKLRAV